MPQLKLKMTLDINPCQHYGKSKPYCLLIGEANLLFSNSKLDTSFFYLLHYCNCLCDYLNYIGDLKYKVTLWCCLVTRLRLRKKKGIEHIKESKK